MKKIIFILASAVLLLSCKKDKEIEPNFNQKYSDVQAHILFGYNDSNVVAPCDGAHIDVFNGSGKLIASGQTGSDGIFTLPPVSVSDNAYFTFKTKSYYISNPSSPIHYEGKINLQLNYYGADTSPKQYFKNYYVCIGNGIGEFPGYGTTTTPEQHPWQ